MCALPSVGERPRGVPAGMGWHARHCLLKLKWLCGRGLAEVCGCLQLQGGDLEGLGRVQLWERAETERERASAGAGGAK